MSSESFTSTVSAGIEWQCRQSVIKQSSYFDHFMVFHHHNIGVPQHFNTCLKTVRVGSWANFIIYKFLARKQRLKCVKWFAAAIQKVYDRGRNWSSSKKLVRIITIMLSFLFARNGFEKDKLMFWREGSSCSSTSLSGLRWLSLWPTSLFNELHSGGESGTERISAVHQWANPNKKHDKSFALHSSSKGMAD